MLDDDDLIPPASNPSGAKFKEVLSVISDATKESCLTEDNSPNSSVRPSKFLMANNSLEYEEEVGRTKTYLDYIKVSTERKRQSDS